MSGLDRLNNKLAKLKGSDAGQIVTDATDGIVSVLLTEIEETILPREMVLTNETGDRFVLLVAGRRLLALGGPGVDDPGPASGDDAAAQIVAAFQGPFRRFLDRAREISIDAGRPHDRIDATTIGCSVEALGAALAGPGQGPQGDPVAAALDLALAGLRLAGDEIVARSGDAPALARLERFAATGAAGLAGVVGGDGDAPSCLFLSGTGQGGAILARVAFRGEAALILAPAEARADLIALCR
ncbi:hypothetical protein [Rhodovulum strictum]|uniref:Uncharacterized protein n=1 Tax=Rhodovulum strictum TaxID=58314 RepID=A0A844BEL2_9RHOB|nr:hypothetical protein [Rhodovulum strictum]MRH19522.1 hypothetical protein [Rhodovulum strictum]